MQPLPEFSKELTVEQQFTQRLLKEQVQLLPRENLESLVLNAYESLAIKDNAIKAMAAQLAKGVQQ